MDKEEVGGVEVEESVDCEELGGGGGGGGA